MLQYECYKYNIYHLIKYYGYKPHWFKIDEFPFHNYTGRKSNNFEDLKDPFLLDYKNVKTKLAEDILKRGMYTPFFYYTNKKGEKCILLGKHRLYSLLKYHNTIEKIDKEFLFIEIPNNPQSVDKSKIEDKDYKRPLYFFTVTTEPILEIPNNEHKVDFILLCTGDSLSRIIHGKDIEPCLEFNVKFDFEKFLSSERRGIKNVTI